jgi:hypothetical protein
MADAGPDVLNLFEVSSSGNAQPASVPAFEDAYSSLLPPTNRPASYTAEPSPVLTGGERSSSCSPPPKAYDVVYDNTKGMQPGIDSAALVDRGADSSQASGDALPQAAIAMASTYLHDIDRQTEERLAFAEGRLGTTT